MDITISIKDKTIKGCISNHLDNEIYDYWDAPTIKAAKLPTKAQLTKEFFEDAKFQKEMVTRLKTYIDGFVAQELRDIIWDIFPVEKIDHLIEACNSVGEENRKKYLLQEQEKELKLTIERLKGLGYKVEKVGKE